MDESSYSRNNMQDLDLFSNEQDMEKLRNFNENMFVYSAAIKEISTKLEILNGEFQAKRMQNPIEHIKSRVKSPKSIMEKLKKNNLELTVEAVKKNVKDVAGIRVICSFISDIYLISDMLKSQDDITLISEKDYIKTPKENGYRSLHLVLEIPVFLSEYTENVFVEVQIRTIAMDFWASLEHKLYYKNRNAKVPTSISSDLKDCANIISATDEIMQKINEYIKYSENLE